MYAARNLPSREFAAIAATLSVMEILRAIADMGADAFIYARIGPPGKRLSQLVRAAMLLRGGLSLGIAAAACLVAAAFTNSLYLLILLLLIPVTAIQANAVALLQKRGRREPLALLVIASLIASAVVAVSVSLFRPVSAGAVLLLVAPDVAAAITAVLLTLGQLRLVLALGNRSFTRAFHVVRYKLAQTTMVNVLSIAYSRLDVLVVLPTCGVFAQSAYSAGFRLVEPFFLLFGIASIALLAELGGRGVSRTRELARTLTAISIPFFMLPALLGAAAICAGLAWWGSMTFVHFKEDGSLLAGVIAAAIPFRILNTMISALLQRLGYFQQIARAAIINAVITFSLALIGARLGGAPAVAAGAVAGEAANFFFQLGVLRRAVFLV